ncbi:MAG TPA: ribosome biogenesis GTPase Der [Polyangiaceae bacterium]|nr:ribosome biogenesis GTPase Der [Polyangiaceae bacterium]
MIPIVAVVGRPNVGKSTLFNRLAGRRLAIVHDTPGVTRDRHYAEAHVHGRDLLLVDTGGFDLTSDDPMGQGIARQVQVAIEEADVIVCVLDGSAAASAPDREAVDLLRRSGKPVIYAANKLDNSARDLEAGELYSLGIPHFVPISALHGRGMAELERALTEALPQSAPAADADDAVPRVTLIGRPNAGKSSLVNRLAGVERALVDHRPGTTRDPIDTRIEFEGKSYVIVDTAGIRRRARVDRGIEAISVMQSIRAMERANVVILMCDAEAGVAEQDARLLGLCAERGRGIIVGLNKLDLLSKEDKKRALENARDALRFAPWAPLVPLSAKTGEGVSELMRRVSAAYDELGKRISTGELNRFFEQVLERRPPPTSGGRAPRIYYITQAETSPPVFVAMSSAPANIPDSYKRFVANQIRDAFGFEGVPVLVRYRQRERRDAPNKGPRGSKKA